MTTEEAKAWWDGLRVSTANALIGAQLTSRSDVETAFRNGDVRHIREIGKRRLKEIGVWLVVPTIPQDIEVLRAELAHIEFVARTWDRYNGLTSVAENIERMVHLLDDLQLLSARHESDAARIRLLEIELRRARSPSRKRSKKLA